MLPSGARCPAVGCNGSTTIQASFQSRRSLLGPMATAKEHTSRLVIRAVRWATTIRRRRTPGGSRSCVSGPIGPRRKPPRSVPRSHRGPPGRVRLGIAALPPAHLTPGGSPDAPYAFAVSCAIATDYDPRQAKGLGGQLAVQNGAVVNHHLRNYVRELGYRASIRGADPFAVTVSAGLGTLDRSG